MHCSIEQLQAFLDHELEPSRAESIRRHLAGCPVCRRELSRMRLLWLELELVIRGLSSVLGRLTGRKRDRP